VSAVASRAVPGAIVAKARSVFPEGTRSGGSHYTDHGMAATFVLPLCPLEDRVLLPGAELVLPSTGRWSRTAVEHAHGFGDAVVASLVDGDSVHEVAVTAVVAETDDGRVSLRGVGRCRVLEVVSEEVPLVRAQRVREPAPVAPRASDLARLLVAHYTRLQRSLGRPIDPARGRTRLSAVTWHLANDLGLTAEQQQGFLNVVDAVTRGRLLLVVLRELERRERFLRPFARLRTGEPWN